MDANTIIDKCGGTSEVASIFSITKAAVSQWRHNGIPPVNLMYLKVIRKDVFEAAKPSSAGHEREAD